MFRALFCKCFLLIVLLLPSLDGAIKTVAFDFGGVLIQIDKTRVIQLISETFEIDDNEALLQLHHYQKAWISSGEDEGLFWQQFAEKKGVELPLNWLATFEDVKLNSIYSTSTVSTLKSLKQQGYSLALLSNITHHQLNTLAQTPMLSLYDYFDPLLLSCEMGVCKPDPLAYEILIEQTGVNADEILFIDDKQENVTAAQEMGIDAVLYENSHKLCQDLADRGIDVPRICEKVVHIDDGIDLWTEAMGAIHNPAVLLISGAGMHAKFWTDTFCKELIDSGFFVIRYDHRDVGLSSAVYYKQAPYELNDLAKDGCAILDAYQIKKAHVVGHSMGGLVAQTMAAYYPHRVCSFVAMASAPVGMTPEVRHAYTPEQQKAFSKVLKELLEIKPTQNFDDSLPRFIKAWGALNGDFPVDEQMVAEYVRDMYNRSKHLVGTFKGHMTVVNKMLAARSLKHYFFNRITAPALIMHGTEDNLFVPSKGGISLSRALANSELMMIEGMGHMIFDRDLEKQIAEKISQFLSK